MLCSFIINMAKMQSDCENICIFKDFDFVTLGRLASHFSSRNLKSHSKFGVQDDPKPFQNALRYKLRVGSPSITASERKWTPKWLPKRGP